MLTVPLNIELHSNQELIHNSQAGNIVVKAGKRFGKTKFATYKVVKWAFSDPGMYWYIAPTYRQAKNIAWREFNTLIPKHLIKRRLENELLIELIGDIPLQLIGADNEDSLRGPKLKGAVLDECAYLNKYIWPNIIRGQLLGSNGEPPGKALFISSPINPLQTIGKDKSDWYKNFFEDAMRKKMAGDTSWDAFHFTIYDNPTLSKSQIDEMKADATEDEWNVEYMAQESSMAGQVYSEFKYGQHVLECKVGSSAVLVRGHDWGIDHPTVCLLVYVDNASKSIYVEDEYVQSGFTIEESCEVINKKTASRPVMWDVCDPSMNKRNSQTKRTDKDEYARLGIPCMAGDNNHRGYNITKMFFKKDIIRIHPRCKTLIKQLKDLQWADKVGDDTCLVAGTKISCLDGPKNIEDIRIGEKVFTRNGYSKVTDSAMTNILADVYELKTSNGKTIVGTFNHPMFLEDGSVRNLGELKEGDFLLDSRYLNLIYSVTWRLRSFLKPVRSLTESASTGWAAGISKNALGTAEKLCYYTVKFGSIILGTFRKVFTFTTWTETNAIIRFPTWSYCLATNIENIMPELLSQGKGQGRTWLNMPFQRQLLGTNLKQVENGTGNTQKSFGKTIRLRNEVAISAEGFTERHSRPVQNFATLIAKWPHFGHVAVASATHLLTKQSVFNLTVENGEYIANGLLVHNCDVLRYVCVRVHDTMFKWNEAKAIEADTKIMKRPFNLNDRMMFPEKSFQSGSSFKQEVNSF